MRVIPWLESLSLGLVYATAAFANAAASSGCAPLYEGSASTGQSGLIASSDPTRTDRGGSNEYFYASENRASYPAVLALQVTMACRLRKLLLAFSLSLVIWVTAIHGTLVIYLSASSPAVDFLATTAGLH
jgi:hypothetical protein